MKKCWAIERAMAASSQPFVRGLITSRDWFSLRLVGEVWSYMRGRGRGRGRGDTC